MATAVASPALAQQRAKLKFVMPTPAATYLLPYFVAQDLGWYRSWGLDMEEQIVQGDANSLRAVIAGDSVVTFIGPPTIMDAVIAGGKIKIFTSWQPVTDYQLITGDKKVRTLKDLEGKRIAVAGPGGMTSHIPLMLMKLAGADGSDVKFLSVGGMSARLQAVAAGKVDATLVDTFFATKAERDGVAHTVASIAKEFPGLGYVFTIARETTLADAAGRTALSIFTKGTINGARFIRKDPAAAAAILKKRLPDEDLGLIQATIEKLNGLNVWGLNGGVEREVLEFSSKTFAELGMVKRGVAYEEIVDPSIVAAVLREVGRN
jgi:ABC-type nitrate/sulfonate/bicarbonate transport system substrate-binding protein